MSVANIPLSFLPPSVRALVVFALVSPLPLVVVGANSLYKLRPYKEQVVESYMMTDRWGRLHIWKTSKRIWRCPPLTEWGLTLGKPRIITACGLFGGATTKEWQFGPLEIAEEHGEISLTEIEEKRLRQAFYIKRP